jgi:hypothetical protein
MNKRIYLKNPYFIIYINLWFSKSFNIVFLCINGIMLLLCEKIHSIKHFGKYNESIIIWYGLWCKVFGISKVQYVVVTQNLFMKFIQCNHITCNIYFWILLTYYSFIFCSMAHDCPTNCDKIMYSTIVCCYFIAHIYVPFEGLENYQNDSLINVLKGQMNSNW